MKEKLDITASIVLYNENLKELTKTIQCFLELPLQKKLYLIDNTPNKLFEDKFNYPEIVYIPVGKNVGFGAGHNRILTAIENTSKYHLVLNPDVVFQKKVIQNLILELEKYKSLGQLMY